MKDDPRLRAELVLAAVELMGRAGRHGTVCVRGESMCPTLQPGQLLAVEFSPPATARGDMLVFRQGEELLVHRLLGPARPQGGRPRLRTRGDGVLALDPAVELDRVVGRVVAVEHDGGWRTTRGRPARLYAWCLARHDLFWAALGSLSRAIDQRLERWGSGLRLRPIVHAVDRRLLRYVHRALFTRVHARVSEPAASRTAD